VGAATFYKLQRRFPNLKILLIEKENKLADHQTGNNSGVIHSGIYYKPGSLKAINCVNGRRELVQFAKDHNIRHDVCGKLIVAADQSELANLEKIYQSGINNGIEGMRRVSPAEIREIEPHVKGIDAVHVGCTGIIDFRRSTEVMTELGLGIQNQSAVHLGEEVIGFERDGEYTRVKTQKASYITKYLVVCGGLQADRLAKKRWHSTKRESGGFQRRLL